MNLRIPAMADIETKYAVDTPTAEPCWCAECVRRGRVTKKEADLMKDLGTLTTSVGATPVEEVLAAVRARWCRRRERSVDTITVQHVEEVRPIPSRPSRIPWV